MESRRYELAKDIFIWLLTKGNKIFLNQNEVTQNLSEGLADVAVTYADTLLARLERDQEKAKEEYEDDVVDDFCFDIDNLEEYENLLKEYRYELISGDNKKRVWKKSFFDKSGFEKYEIEYTIVDQCKYDFDFDAETIYVWLRIRSHHLFDVNLKDDIGIRPTEMLAERMYQFHRKQYK